MIDLTRMFSASSVSNQTHNKRENCMNKQHTVHDANDMYKMNYLSIRPVVMKYNKIPRAKCMCLFKPIEYLELLCFNPVFMCIQWV